jgi:hypothetical protein
MDDESADKAARSLLDVRLGLQYVEVFNTRKAIKIASVVLGFSIAILFLRFSATTTEFFIGACGLLFAIQRILGAPTEIRLTKDSYQRLQVWLVNDEEPDEEPDGEPDKEVGG